MGEQPIRWGICGTGGIAVRFVEALAEVPDARVVAMASRTPGRAAEVGGPLGIARAHDSQADLAADDEVDVVYVATTQDDHRAATVRFLDAGRAVLCEKPLALDVGQATTMVEAARRNQRFLMEAIWSRFLPGYQALGRVLADGRIGRPLTVDADFAFRVPSASVAGHRLFDPERGGGGLLDLGIYPLQLAQMVLGQPDRVRAVGTLTDRGVDEQCAVVLGHPDGSTARLFCATRVNGPCTARIGGEHGSITLDAMMHCPTRLVVETAEGTEIIDVDPPSLGDQVPHVHAALRAGRIESDVVPWTDSLGLAATMDEVRRQIGVRYPTDG